MTGPFAYRRWCRRGESNPRPQPYQGCALPLSYGGQIRGTGPIAKAIGGGKAKDRLDRKSFPVLTAFMTESPDVPATPETKPEPTPEQKAKADRALRLAQALRANLKRRKAPAAATTPRVSN